MEISKDRHDDVVQEEWVDAPKKQRIIYLGLGTLEAIGFVDEELLDTSFLPAKHLGVLVVIAMKVGPNGLLIVSIRHWPPFLYIGVPNGAFVDLLL